MPVGYVHRPSGEVTFDPDEQVQAIVRTIFEQFERQGSVGAVLRYLIANRMELPVCMHAGPYKGSLQWRRPNKIALRNMLWHPMHAAAYAYGRSRKDNQARPKKRRQRWLPPEQWQVLLRDRYPAYITWEQYERNVAQIKENQAHVQRRGPIRPGRTLLTGLAVCGHCGARTMTHQSGKNVLPR